MNYKRLLLGILLFPITIPVGIILLILYLAYLISIGLEYIFTGKYNA